MNLTNILFELVSLTNLTIFLNRLMSDGQYKSAILLYDYESIRDTSFIRDLTDLSNFNYTFISVNLDKSESSFRMTDLISYQNLPNALHIVMAAESEWFGRTLNNRYSIYSRDAVFLLPMQPASRKQEILRTFSTLLRVEYNLRGNVCLIFYGTPHTIQQTVSSKWIEAFVVTSQLIPANRSVFGIDVRSDIHFQLDQTLNLRKKIFAPVQKSLMYFYVFDELRKVKNIEKNKIVMSENANVYMANFITRNTKNLTTWQFVQRKFGNIREGLIKYEPSSESIYAELLMTSMDIYENKNYLKLWVFFCDIFEEQWAWSGAREILSSRCSTTNYGVMLPCEYVTY